MTAGRTSALAATSLSLVLSACQTVPAGLVGAKIASADGAIVIAMKHCTIDRGDTDETNAANWSAKLVDQSWNVTYTAPPSLALRNIEIGTITTKISTRDGTASDCLAQMVVTAH
jgi:hypothetical protein